MALPGNVSYGSVTGTFLRAVADDPLDEDRDPEGLPIVGLTVTFTPDLANRTVTDTSATPPVFILVESFRATTDATGTLVGPDLLPGIRLLASTDPDLTPHNWTWKVTIEGSTYQRASFSFLLNPDETVDLSTVVPLPANPGDEVDAWLNAVQATALNVTAAQSYMDQAFLARNTAVTSASQALGYRDEAEAAAADAAATLAAFPNIVLVTQAEYDALTPDPSTLYFITD